MQNNKEDEHCEHSSGNSCTQNFAIEILYQPCLEELQTVLTVALKVVFEDVKVKITSCPQLTKEPFNLAANGLHGNTAIIRCDTKTMTQRKWNMKYFLQNIPYDSFLIGGGFGAKPNLPSNGYLIMNATFSRPEQINNASRLAYVRSFTDSGIVEIMKEPDQMTCCATGNFFMSEGRPGLVLEVRAKKRKYSRTNIISIIGKALYLNYKIKDKVVGLGGVLLINKGEVLVSVISNNIPENQIISSNDLLNRVEHRPINCTSNITAFGTVVGSKETLLSAADDLLRMSHRTKQNM
ncbi:ester hydrolase C11orf54 homolog isoform X2 [Linepithema humile]|uniref:ester hydrolase C11orf54 homolog isoform X2 n=1 Tax=Linepithema humile TaxID=83485 RepID=UPI00351F4545